MIEMVLLEETKETENKVRWDADIEDTKFSLYIPKWRVPEPWPQTIHVTITPYDQSKVSSISRLEAKNSPRLRYKPIIAHLKKYREHTQTIRYQPEGDPKGREIGEPYIPYHMTYDGAGHLTITVNMKIKPKILIVEDDEVSADFLDKALRDSGYQTITVHDGRQALEKAVDEFPDLILLNVIMPNLDGFEVCKRLKCDDRTKNIPIIFETGQRDIDQIIRGFDLGADHYIIKPFKIILLLAQIRNSLRRIDCNYFIQ